MFGLNTCLSFSIGNMDETPAYFDIVATRSVGKIGVKLCDPFNRSWETTLDRCTQCAIRSTGAEKRHLTVVLSVRSVPQELRNDTWPLYSVCDPFNRSWETTLDRCTHGDCWWQHAPSFHNIQRAADRKSDRDGFAWRCCCSTPGKGWMAGKIMPLYLGKIWFPYVRKIGGEAAKSLLVWDSFSAHLINDVQELVTKQNTTPQWSQEEAPQNCNH